MLYIMDFLIKQFCIYKQYSQCVQSLPVGNPNMTVQQKHYSQLHWLPIKQRINFKIATITHRCIYGTAPQYLKDLLILASNPRSLRSSNDRTKLIIPFTRCKTFAMHSFSIAAPTIWNQLPMSVRETTNFELFKRQLKTYLYRAAFYSVP